MLEGRLPLDAPVEIRLRRIIGPDHPLWSAAIETINRLPPSRKRHGDQTWPRWFAYLEHVGVLPLDATEDDVEAFLSQFESRGDRATRRCILRDLYRAAFDLGLVPEMPIPDMVIGLDYRGAQRLTNAEVVRLVDSLARDCLVRHHALRARRDLVLVALACSIERRIDDLRVLTWGDLDLEGRTKTMRVRRGDRIEQVALADVVLARIGEFRDELGRHGVDVVADDALLPALGKRIEWDWTLPERSLLAPLGQKSIHLAFKVMIRQASIGQSYESGRYFNHRWLLRSPGDLAEVLGGTHATATPKVPMRRTALERNPDGSLLAA